MPHHQQPEPAPSHRRRARPTSSGDVSAVAQLTQGLAFTYAQLHPMPTKPSAPTLSATTATKTRVAAETPAKTDDTHPRRILTKKTKPSGNDGLDNEEQNLIVRVRDVLGGRDALPVQPAFVVLDMLGQGTFGQVFRCQNVETKELVAIKVIRNHPSYYKQAIVEVQITRMLNASYTKDEAPHFVRMMDTFEFRNHLCIVFELLSINVYELIAENNFNGFPLEVTRGFQQQILHALVRMDEIGVIHCDLKPENILLVGQDQFLSDVVYDNDPQMARLLVTSDATADSAARTPYIKVVDFGSACMENETVYSYIQSRFYRSPEVLLGIPYTGSIDLWSLGCIAVEMVLGLPLFPGVSEHDQLRLIEETLGKLPQELLRKGRNVLKFYNVTADNRFVLKTPAEFARDTNAEVQVSKKYFKYTKLEDMIHAYPYAKHSTESQRRHERERRDAFLHFVRGLLCVDPLARTSASAAMRHPFITGAPFDVAEPIPKAVPTAVAPHSFEYAPTTVQAWASPVPPLDETPVYGDSTNLWMPSRLMPSYAIPDESQYYEDDHITPTAEYYGSAYLPPPTQFEKPTTKVAPAFADPPSNRVYPYDPYGGGSGDSQVPKAYDGVVYTPTQCRVTPTQSSSLTSSSDSYPIVPMSPYDSVDYASPYYTQPLLDISANEWPYGDARYDHLPPPNTDEWTLPRHHQYQSTQPPLRRGKRQHTNSWDSGDLRELRRHEAMYPPVQYATPSQPRSTGSSAGSTSGRSHHHHHHHHHGTPRRSDHKNRSSGGGASGGTRHRGKSVGGGGAKTSQQAQYPLYRYAQQPMSETPRQQVYYDSYDGGSEGMVSQRRGPYAAPATRDEATNVCSVEEKFSSVMSLDRQNPAVPLPT